MLGIRVGRHLPAPRTGMFMFPQREIVPFIFRTLHLSRTPLAKKDLGLIYPLMATVSLSKAPNNRNYSTKTAPPPPPPPGPEKDAKGRALLHKITGFTTFSASLLLVISGVGFCGFVLYLILSELFLPSGDTKTFNKAVSLVEKNAQAQEALEFKPGDRLKAYGEVPGDKWVRNRPVQSVRQKGSDGKDHLVMRFHVESAAGKHASVYLEQIDTSFWSSEFAYVALELPFKKRIYIVEPKFAPKNYVPRPGVFTGSGFLGLSWGPKKD